MDQRKHFLTDQGNQARVIVDDDDVEEKEKGEGAGGREMQGGGH